MKHDLYKSLGDVDMCRKFNMFEIQVPIIFSAYRFFRHAGIDITFCISKRIFEILISLLSTSFLLSGSHVCLP
jgi:hypothetical protein